MRFSTLATTFLAASSSARQLASPDRASNSSSATDKFVQPNIQTIRPESLKPDGGQVDCSPLQRGLAHLDGVARGWVSTVIGHHLVDIAIPNPQALRGIPIVASLPTVAKALVSDSILNIFPNTAMLKLVQASSENCKFETLSVKSDATSEFVRNLGRAYEVGGIARTING